MNRVVSIGGAELLLLWRNRLALFNALLLPPVFGLLFVPRMSGTGISPAAAATLIGGMIGVILAIVVYHNLVGAYVARREELTLKRLRAGTPNAAEILAGTASPAVSIALAQSLLTVVVAAVYLELPVPANPLLLAVGLFGGVAVFVVLAAASAIVTSTIELAQITTTPMLLACFLGAGLWFPLDDLPAPVRTVFELLPLGPVIELITLGWAGTETLSDAFRPLLLLAAWTAAGITIIQRWFRWEPRR
ncbi:ABC transporter permease [Catenuloplanes atrovinosus]|uniref:ABC-2 type transport system permease protein n=1 Tax=Catenuloplanes atrovinosus TaxID=137266 RepID=A0AAE4C859_9ACTN|nr:ABC transporter permease [Catenuloplanes atrovinosus]MDR7274648.1 ABC-2 type transport system permease protein [Catenuloplanes atrovinosus]